MRSLRFPPAPPTPQAPSASVPRAVDRRTVLRTAAGGLVAVPVSTATAAVAAPNTSPLDGFQHFGEVEVAPGGGELRVVLRGQCGEELWSTTLKAEGR